MPRFPSVAPLLALLLPFSLALHGCDPDPVDEDPTPVPTDCNPEILQPASLTDAYPIRPADPHAETFGAEPAPRNVRLQWPSTDPSTSAAMLWVTDSATRSTVVEWWIGEEDPRTTQGASVELSAAVDSEAGVRLHEVRLCGLLAPATTYSYRVGGEGNWSPTYSFSTPGAPRSFDTARVAFVGDSRGAYTSWAELVRLIDLQDPDFIVFSGDLVNLGVFQSEWDEWFAAMGEVMARRVVVPAHGNHEILATNYFAQFALPGNEEWFNLEYGPLQLVTLNDTVRDQSDITVVQTAFLDDALAGSDAPWKIVQHHRPAYTISERHPSDLTLRKAWSPIFDQHDVDLVVTGHNHIYERSAPIRGDAPADDGTVYIVTGGAGAPLYEDVDEGWWNEVADPVEHYMIGDFSLTEAQFTVRDLSDTVIDTFTLTK